MLLRKQLKTRVKALLGTTETLPHQAYLSGLSDSAFILAELLLDRGVEVHMVLPVCLQDFQAFCAGSELHAGSDPAQWWAQTEGILARCQLHFASSDTEQLPLDASLQPVLAHTRRMCLGLALLASQAEPSRKPPIFLIAAQQPITSIEGKATETTGSVSTAAAKSSPNPNTMMVPVLPVARPVVLRVDLRAVRAESVRGLLDEQKNLTCISAMEYKQHSEHPFVRVNKSNISEPAESMRSNPNNPNNPTSTSISPEGPHGPEAEVEVMKAINDPGLFEPVQPLDPDLLRICGSQYASSPTDQSSQPSRTAPPRDHGKPHSSVGVGTGSRRAKRGIKAGKNGNDAEAEYTSRELLELSAALRALDNEGSDSGGNGSEVELNEAEREQLATQPDLSLRREMEHRFMHQKRVARRNHKRSVRYTRTHQNIIIFIPALDLCTPNLI